MSMNKQELVEALLFAGFRLMASGLILVGGLALVFELAGSWYRFDPNYLSSWFAATLLRPLLLLAAGTGLYFTAPGMARRMSAPFRAGQS